MLLFRSFNTTNHIFIGLIYIIAGSIGGAFGPALSIPIRVEIALPGYVLCPSLQYNSRITFHGISMIFFMIMPLPIGGFGNFPIPLMLCSSDMIFPRLNALSLWLIVDSLFLLLSSIFLDGGVNAGWTFYVPLSIPNDSPVDPMFFSLHLAGLSPLLGSINFIVTLIKGCNLSIWYSSFFIPLYPWSIFFTPLLLILSLPVSAGCITTIIHDRHFNSSPFDPLRGGDLLSFQHLFRFFGHPEVYIPILPPFGSISEILSKYVQCFIFGRDSMVIALFVIGLPGCIVWGHHTSIVGFDLDTRSYFTTVTPIIAVPTGIKILNRFATIGSGCLFSTTPLFPILGFLFSSTSGGFTGPIPANSMIDTPLHDSYSVVGHFHYVLPLGALYTFFAAFHHYLVFFSPTPFSDPSGRLHFITSFTSPNTIFLPMHPLGPNGFSRRIFDYPIAFSRYQWASSLAVIGILISLGFFIRSTVSLTTTGRSFYSFFFFIPLINEHETKNE